MNYLKNRYPFKLLTTIYRIATRTGESLQPSAVELKRNKSDLVLESEPNATPKDKLKLKKHASVTVCHTASDTTETSLEHQLITADSYNSLPLSKTSSENSVKNAPLGKTENTSRAVFPKKRKTSMDRELNLKLQQLQQSFIGPEKSDSRVRLKRAYPWQNFNLNSVAHVDFDLSKRPAKLARSACRESLSSISVSSTSRKSSLRSFNSSTVSLQGKTSKDSLNDLNNETPLVKTVAKKPQPRPIKQATFNNISTIYRSTQQRDNKDKKNTFTKNFNSSVVSRYKSDNEAIRNLHKPNVAERSGRHESLKEEHSFLYLYTGKKQKIS